MSFREKVLIRKLVPALTIWVAFGVAVAHDGPSESRIEFLVSSGRMFPTGPLEEILGNGEITAAQLSYLFRSSMAATTTIGWTRSRDIAIGGNPKLDAFSYDFGAEFRGPALFAPSRVTLKPFAGVGAGMRTYNYRSLNEDATHNAAGYGSAGGELGYWRLRLRLEVRDYVTWGKPFTGNGSSAMRNDLAALIGLRIAAR